MLSRLYFTLFRSRSRDPAPRGYLLQPADPGCPVFLSLPMSPGERGGQGTVTPLLQTAAPLRAILDTDKSCPSFFSTRAILSVRRSAYPLSRFADPHPLSSILPLHPELFLLPPSFNGHGRISGDDDDFSSAPAGLFQRREFYLALPPLI